MHELPLVFFTVFAQTAAGMVFLATIGRLFFNAAFDTVQRIYLFALILMAAGMCLAALHLGHPFRALNVIFGFGRSSMSNEIFLFGFLFGLTFLAVLLPRLIKSQLVNILLSIALIIASFMLVYVITVVYTLDTVKTWNTVFTGTQMFISMFTAGGIAVAVLGLRRIGIISTLIGIIVSLLIKLPYIDFIKKISVSLAQAQLPLWYTQIALSIAALLLTVFVLCKPHVSRYYLLLALLLIVAGELCGRTAFYNLWTIPM